MSCVAARLVCRLPPAVPLLPAACSTTAIFSGFDFDTGLRVRCDGRHAVMLLQQQQLQQQVLSSASALQMLQQTQHDESAGKVALQDELASLQAKYSHLQDNNAALKHEISSLQTRIKEVGLLSWAPLCRLPPWPYFASDLLHVLVWLISCLFLADFGAARRDGALCLRQRGGTRERESKNEGARIGGTARQLAMA